MQPNIIVTFYFQEIYLNLEKVMVDNEKINFFREFFSFKTNKAEGIIGFHRALGIGSWDMFNGGTGGLIGSWLL